VTKLERHKYKKLAINIVQGINSDIFKSSEQETDSKTGRVTNTVPNSSEDFLRRKQIVEDVLNEPGVDFFISYKHTSPSEITTFVFDTILRCTIFSLKTTDRLYCIADEVADYLVEVNKHLRKVD